MSRPLAHFARVSPLRRPMAAPTLTREAAAAADSAVVTAATGGADLLLFPKWQTKTLYLIRHGQGFHNVAGEADQKAYQREEFRDSHLTQAGWEQAEALGRHLTAQPVSLDLVVTSPLTRALETAVGVFGAPLLQLPASQRQGTHTSEPSTSRLLMSKQEAVPGRVVARPAAWGMRLPPIVATELCIERLSARHPCDQRRPTSLLQERFQGVDFSGLPELPTPLARLDADQREPLELVKARALRFLTWVRQRPEASIAVVSHGGFLYHLLSMFPPTAGTLAGPAPFENCELRSVMLVDPTAQEGDDPTLFPGGLLARM